MHKAAEGFPNVELLSARIWIILNTLADTFRQLSLNDLTYLEILLVPTWILAKETDYNLTIHLLCSFFFCPLDHFLCSFQTDFPSGVGQLRVEVGGYQVRSLSERIIGRVPIFDRFCW